jgi:membrane protease YdiL (CAAX protease family)
MLNTNSFVPSKVISLVSIFACFGLIFIPFLKFPFKFMAITAIILLVVFLQDGHLRGLNFKRLNAKAIITIVCIYAILELVMDFAIQPLMAKIFNEPADYTAFNFIEGDAQNYFKYLLYMWVSAAVGEEVLFRGFMTLQLRRIIGERKFIIVLLTSILFSLPHLYQGLSGLVMTFLFGLVFGFVYIKFNNIWINIIVHGLIDSLFLTLAYYGETGFYS